MYVAALWPAVLGALVAIAHARPNIRTRSLSKRAPESPAFVSTENGKFVVNGAPLKFIGTNAYWLAALNSEEDIDKTLASIAEAGIRVVRTWAFNDVTDIPEQGTWFQQIKDGKFLINEGPNGLQKLDKVVELAEKHGIYLVLSLTNNWNPSTNSTTDVPEATRKRTRNTLSNDYGGMDVYVRDAGLTHHNTFYNNNNIVEQFKNYTTQIVKRYVKSTAVFSWELANDPRCNSTLPAAQCNPQDITKWHDDIAAHIRTIDTNHLISSGSAGWYCTDCPKLHPLSVAPPPQASPAPGSRRRGLSQYLTKRKLLQIRRDARKRNAARLAKRQAVNNNSTGFRIRGRWAPTATRRQLDLQSVGPAYDGTYGVDSQDILNGPNMDYGSAQFFPDQNSYAPYDPNLSVFENKVEIGNEWIQVQAATAADFGKPVTVNAFGLVTQDNAPNFVPFDSNVAPYAADPATGAPATPYGLTNEQRDEAYGTWFNTGLQSGLETMIQYQWGQENLQAAPGVPVSTNTDTATPVGDQQNVLGVSPNDGYSINGVGRSEVVGVIQQGNQNFGSDSLLRR